MLKILKALDKNLDELKKKIYQKDTLSISSEELIVFKSISNRVEDTMALIDYIQRNRHELCNTTSSSPFTNSK